MYILETNIKTMTIIYIIIYASTLLGTPKQSTPQGTKLDHGVIALFKHSKYI